MKLIELTENHYIVVDDSEIKKHDWYFNHPNKEICQSFFNRIPLEFGKCKKITHSTKPIETLSNGDDVFIRINELNLSEAKALVGKVDVEELAEQYAKAHSIYESAQDDVAYGFREGYNQCLEDNKDKKYSEDDMIKFVNWIETSQKASDYERKNRMRFECRMDGNPEIEKRLPELLNLYLQSHQPIKEWEVEFENGKLKLL